MGQTRAGRRLAFDLGDPGRAEAGRAGHRPRRVCRAELRHPGRVSATAPSAGEGAPLHRLSQDGLQPARLLGGRDLGSARAGRRAEVTALPFLAKQETEVEESGYIELQRRIHDQQALARRSGPEQSLEHRLEIELLLVVIESQGWLEVLQGLPLLGALCISA
ncbi:protein of unknown function [Thauera humireducens]|nr:protein of unknown function [Thauera humireducens]